MSVFDHPKPSFPEDKVGELLAHDYGLVGTLQTLVSERDQNFLIETADGRYVLKIANEVEEGKLLELQNAALKHLAQVDPNLGVPRVTRSKTGATSHTGRLMVRPMPLGSQAICPVTFIHQQRKPAIAR